MFEQLSSKVRLILLLGTVISLYSGGDNLPENCAANATRMRGNSVLARDKEFARARARTFSISRLDVVIHKAVGPIIERAP